MIDLNHEGLMDYYRCPMKYKFKHILGLSPTNSYDNARDTEQYKRYKTTLHQAVMFFYYNKMNGDTPSLAHLQSKWFKLWAGEDLTPEEMAFKGPAGARQRTRDNKKIEVVKILNEFYDTEMETDFTPIMVDTDIRVQVGDFYVTGNIDLVREMRYEGKSFIQLDRFMTTRFGLDQFFADNDFGMLLQVYAFRKLFETKEDVAYITDIKRAEKINVAYNDVHFKRFEGIVNNIGACIQEERFHPQVMHQCTTCPYLDICKQTMKH